MSAEIAGEEAKINRISLYQSYRYVSFLPCLLLLPFSLVSPLSLGAYENFYTFNIFALRNTLFCVRTFLLMSHSTVTFRLFIAVYVYHTYTHKSCTQNVIRNKNQKHLGPVIKFDCQEHSETATLLSGRWRA